MDQDSPYLTEFAAKQRQAALDRYYQNPKICLNCEQVIAVGPNERPAETRIKKFCNRSCAAIYHNAHPTEKIKQGRRKWKCKGCKLEKERPSKCATLCEECYLLSHPIKTPEDTSQEKIRYNAYMKKYMLERYHERMDGAREFLGGACSACGSKDNLEIDHIDPKLKEFTLSSMWNLSEEKFYKELQKCWLLCEKCHQNKTASEQRKPVTHGTISGYQHYKCRCNLCREAQRNYKRARKAKTLDSQTLPSDVNINNMGP